MSKIFRDGALSMRQTAGTGGEPIPGPAGPPNVLTVGTVTTLAPGEQATVEITGTSPAQVINFGIPEGEPGEPAPDDAYTPSNPPPAISTLPQNIDGNTPGGMDAIKPNSLAHVGSSAEGNTTGNTINVIDMTIGPDSFQLCADPNDSRAWVRTRDGSGWKPLKEIYTTGNLPASISLASQAINAGEEMGSMVSNSIAFVEVGAIGNTSGLNLVAFDMEESSYSARYGWQICASPDEGRIFARGAKWPMVELATTALVNDATREIKALREEVERLKAMMKKS